MEYKYAIFQTNELQFLNSCVKTGSYGESDGAFRASKYDNLREVRDIQIGDRIFIHLKGKLYCGPFFVTKPHPEFIINTSKANWHRVNIESTPREYHPVWLSMKPWCFFFDKELASQVNYCYFELLNRAKFRIRRIGLITPDEGERLWKFIDEYGNPISDFLQRNEGFSFTHTRPSQFHQGAISKGLFTVKENSSFYRTRNGIFVRSKSEMLIANFLHDHRFRFEYERPTLLESKLIRPDFYLPDCDLIVEHLGLYESSADYRKDWEWKKSLYEKCNRKYITLFETDIPQLESTLLVKLSQVGCKASM